MERRYELQYQMITFRKARLDLKEILKQGFQCLSFEAALFDSSLASSKLCIYTFTESEYPLASLEQHIEQLKRQKTNNKCVAPALAAKPPQHKQQQQQQQQK
ncbi:hypothetical protein JHK84_043424 [Glycine max]|nr:hypothetical protein JHK86_043238 [Glycine max]KAG5117311.1 hypothetical protein JHK84_043424 [Glycine max]